MCKLGHFQNARTKKRKAVYTSSLQALIHISQSYFQAIFYLDLGFFFYFLHPCKESNVSSFVDTVNFQKVMHQSIPAAPSAPPPPGLLRGICRLFQSRGWGICKFCAARGPGICQPRGHSRAFVTHAVSYQNITRQIILLGKKADSVICRGQEKIEEAVQACS